MKGITKMTTVATTKSARFLAALQAGEALSPAQIRARFGLANPKATVTDLRFAGHAIYTNSKKNSKGETSTVYRMGRPSRAVVAAGYKALARGLV